VKKLCRWIFFSCVFFTSTCNIAWNFMSNLCAYLVFSSHPMRRNFQILHGYPTLSLCLVKSFIFSSLFCSSIGLGFHYFPKYHLSLPLILSEHVTMTNPLCDKLLVYSYKIIFIMIIIIIIFLLIIENNNSSLLINFNLF